MHIMFPSDTTQIRVIPRATVAWVRSSNLGASRPNAHGRRIMFQTVKTSKVDPVLQAEWALLIPHFDKDYKAFFQLLLETGIRTSEALALKASDIGVHTDGIRTTVQIKRLKRGKKNIPSVIVSASLAGELRTLGRKRRPKLFKFSRVAAWKALKRISDYAGIRQLTPHQFRHTFARQFAKKTQYDELGRPLSALDHRIMLANMLGHSSIRWVETYFQPHGNELTEATGAMSDLFSTWGSA